MVESINFDVDIYIFNFNFDIINIHKCPLTAEKAKVYPCGVQCLQCLCHLTIMDILHFDVCIEKIINMDGDVWE